ncbi:hypothetical protein BKA81DRAFT_436204 [Phyllosticta paracitricarpa]
MTPGISVISDVDQDPARVLVFIVSGFILQHFLRCGKCYFTDELFYSHVRGLLWRVGGVHLPTKEIQGLISRLQHSTEGFAYNVAAVTDFDRRFCEVLRATRSFLFNPPRTGYEEFYHGQVTWLNLADLWKDLSKDIAASEDGQRFNVAALNRELEGRLSQYHCNRLPPPLTDAPPYSAYRQTPRQRNQVFESY